MYKNDAGKLIFSPSDLMVFMESEYASMMDRHHREFPGRFVPDEQTATNELLAARGDAHEKAVLDEFKSNGNTVLEIEADRSRMPEAVAETRAALDGHADVIFQAVLTAGPFSGFSDFLVKDPESGQWEVWDTKLARSVKSKFLIQLCCYAEMIEEMTGTLPGKIGVILGDGTRESFTTTEYYSYYKEVKKAFMEHMDAFNPDVLPDPTGFGTNGKWDSLASDWVAETDHLSQVANMRHSQVKRLADVDIATMSALAQTDLEKVKGIGNEVFQRLKAQAKLQIATGNDHTPQFQVVMPAEGGRVAGLQLLPPSSSLDVFFDMEGYPLEVGGLEYLFGASTHDGGQNGGSENGGGQNQFHDWWACDKASEQAAFEGFVDWVYERWRLDPDMHIYHYAHYEVTALKRLMGAYASRETKIDNLLRGNVFVDLYQVVRQGICAGTPSYSIKDIERLYRGKRSGGVGTAADSIVAFDDWIQSGEPAGLEAVGHSEGHPRLQRGRLCLDARTRQLAPRSPNRGRHRLGRAGKAG